MNAPDILFYSTIRLIDGQEETPHYLIFDRIAEGVNAIKHHYQEKKLYIAEIDLKELLYIETRPLPEEAIILLPTNDFGVSEDFRNPVEHQKMVNNAEEDNVEEAMMGIYPDEQDVEDLLCRAYFMGPFMKAKSPDAYMQELTRNPFETSEVIDSLHLYRPTGESKTINVTQS